jgi:hypothetical protein
MLQSVTDLQALLMTLAKGRSNKTFIVQVSLTIVIMMIAVQATEDSFLARTS